MNATQRIVLTITATILAAADAHAGRWLSRDPIQDGSGFVRRDPNPYAFVLNNPIKSVDGDGRVTISLEIDEPTHCGGWHHVWKLDFGNQSKETYLVQHVTYSLILQACPSPGYKSPIEHFGDNWYEAWKVPAGTPAITYDGDNMPPQHTRGLALTTTANFKLFRVEDVEDVVGTWTSHTGNDVVQSGSTPDFWNKGLEIDSGADRSSSSGFDCCCGPYKNGTVTHSP